MSCVGVIGGDSRNLVAKLKKYSAISFLGHRDIGVWKFCIKYKFVKSITKHGQ